MNMLWDFQTVMEENSCVWNNDKLIHNDELI